MPAMRNVSPSPAPDTAAPAASAAEATQYLTFQLGGEMFAIGILAIREIIGYGAITTVPMMPKSVRGVINLRGAVVPVMDLQARFGKESSAVGRRTCIVVAEVDSHGEKQVIGALVDAVNEVIEISPADIELPPPFGAHIRADFIRGMGKIRGRFVIVLDLDRALATDDLMDVNPPRILSPPPA